MSARFDPIDNDLFRDQQRKKFLELKFCYETQLDEKDRDIKRHAAKIERMKRELENKFLMRRDVEESLKSVREKNSELERMLTDLMNTKMEVQADLRKDVVFQFFIYLGP